jgi:hypothetical protein
MLRISAALAAVLLMSCAAERHERAKGTDPTDPTARVPAPKKTEDALAPVKLVPEDEDEKKKDDDPHAHHHHHGGAP